MLIENKTTGKTTEVDEATWEALEANNLDRKFIILKQSTELPVIPDESKQADYPSIIKLAKQNYKDESFEVALQFYKKAYSITETPSVKRKIEELEDKLGLVEKKED